MSVITLRAASTNTDPGPLFLKTGAATVHDCIDDPVGGWDEDATMLSHITIAYWVVPETMPASLTIASVQLITRMRERGGAVNSSFTPTIRISGVSYPGVTYGPVASNDWVFQFDSWLLNPNTGLPWTTAGVNSITFGGTGVVVGDEMDVTQQYLLIDFVPSSVRLGAARDTGSRFLRLFRRALGTIDVRAPLRFGDAELLDDLTLSHFAYPTSDDVGAGPKVWDRVHLRKLSDELDLASMTVKMRLLVLRDFLCLYWDTMSAELPPAFSDGVARVDAGAGRLFTRASSAWIENAATALQGTKQVVEVATNAEKHTDAGELFEGAATNLQIESSFKNALTGWTSAGTGSNGSAIAADTADLLFDPSVSGNSVKFTAGTPIHAADLTLTGTTTASVSSSSLVSVSVDHKDQSGAALSVAIRRNVDANYWRDSDSTWQAALTWNSMTAATTPTRWASKQINVGAGATTLTVLVGIPTATGVAGQLNQLYHVQVEVYRYPSSRILTTGVSVTRAADLLKVENFHGRPVFLPERGYAHCTFTPEWNSTDLAAGATLFLWIAYYDASNLYRLFYNQASSAFVFRVRIGGANTSASCAQVVTRGTTYEIGCRWTSAAGELDLDPYKYDVFVNGVQGTGNFGSGIPVSLPAAPYLYLGCDQATANHCDGWLKHFVIGQAVFTNEEMADLP